jgi:hypothetical protein
MCHVSRLPPPSPITQGYMVLLWVYRASEIKKNLLSKITTDSLQQLGGRLPSHQFNMLLMSFARRVTQTPSVAGVLFSYISSILSGCPHLCTGMSAHACITALVSAATAAPGAAHGVTCDKITALVTSTLNCRVLPVRARTHSRIEKV